MVSYYFVTMHILLDKFGQEFELNKVLLDFFKLRKYEETGEKSTIFTMF